MASKYDAKTKTIAELMVQRERLVVPTFQRGYEWTKKEVEKLWLDIRDFQNDLAKTSDRQQYFLGPIVLLPQTRDTIELLDGQQRLATIIILLSVIRDAATASTLNAGRDLATTIQKQLFQKNESDFFLTLGESDREYFQDFILSESPTLRPTIRTHHNIKAARDLLSARINKLVTGSSPEAAVMMLTTLKATIVSEFVMACIEVGSQDDAFRIFETLNDRGLPLAAPDLLLNYLMWKAEPKSDRDAIREQWDNMVGTLKRQNIEKFLRVFWVSQYGDLKEGKLFGAIKEKIVESGWSSLKFVRSCVVECPDFYSIVMHDKDELGDKGTMLTRRILKDLSAGLALPFLLSAFRTLSRDGFVKAASLALVFITRYSVIMHLDPSGMESLLFRLAAEIREKMKGATKANRSAKEKACLHSLKTEFIAKSPSDKSIEGEVPQLLLDPDEASYFVSRLASRMQTQTKEVSFDKVSLEHIFPQNPDKTEWSKGEIESLSPLLWHLGNLTMIGKKKNENSCKNLSYEKKKPHFKTSEVTMTQGIAKQYDKWSKKEIEERATHQTRRILEIWNFENTNLA